MKKEEEKKKLTYEELESYAQQTAIRAKQVYDENAKLKQTIQDIKTQINYNDIGFAFKVLEYKDSFNKEFVKKVAERLEIILTPTDNENNTESENKTE